MRNFDWVEGERLLATYWLHLNGYKVLDGRDSKSVELSMILRATDLFWPFEGRKENYRSASSVSRKMQNIIDTEKADPNERSHGALGDAQILVQFREDPSSSIKKALELLELIAAHATDELSEALSLEQIEIIEAEEGGARLVSHLRRERNPALRRAKLAAVREAGGDISCEVCSFDFGAFYGERGRGYIEVHHVQPLHVSGKTVTALSDLALLCANCHRMIHNRKDWLKPSDLVSLVKANK